MGLRPIAPPKGFPIALWKPSVAKYLGILRISAFYPDSSLLIIAKRSEENRKERLCCKYVSFPDVVIARRQAITAAGQFM